MYNEALVSLWSDGGNVIVTGCNNTGRINMLDIRMPVLQRVCL